LWITKNQIDIVREQMNLFKRQRDGRYDGISCEIETVANTALKYWTSGILFDNKGDIFEDNENEKIGPIIRKFVEYVKSGRLWLSSDHAKLPKNYIERRFRRTKNIWGEFKPEKYSFLKLVASTESKLVLIVDDPGMGKSSSITKLELDLRNIPGFRLVIRINLNQYSDVLCNLSYDELTINEFIKEFFPFIPIELLQKNNMDRIPIYILLDGLDEVLPNYKDTMIKILQVFLCEESSSSDLYVKKVVLTSRPHLQKLIERTFFVDSYCLVPLIKEEQISYLVNQINTEGFTCEIAKRKLDMLPSHVHDLMEIPLMLHLYSEVCRDSISNVFDLFTLYTRFVDKKHERYIYEKDGSDPAKKATEKKKQKLLENNLRFYNYLAVNELLWTADCKNKRRLDVGKVLVMDGRCGGGTRIKEPARDDIDELLSYGLVVIRSEGLKFQHKSYAEYFYARMLTDLNRTPERLRNALFALGYEVESDLAKFVSSVMSEENIHKVFSIGWSEFTPVKCEVSKYATDGMLLDHIFSRTIDYPGECAGKIRLLVRDSFKNQAFIKWLKKQESEKGKSWVQKILLYENMNEFVAAVALLGDTEALQWLTCLLGTEKIRNVISNCNKTFHLATRSRRYLDVPKPISTESLKEALERYKRIGIWPTNPICLKSSLRYWIQTKNVNLRTKFFKCTLKDVELSNWLVAVFTRQDLIELIAKDISRVSDINGRYIQEVQRCLGEEFIPSEILKFRCICDEDRGKSLFQFLVLDNVFLLNDTVWDEIERNVSDAVKVILDDDNLAIVRKLEESIQHYEVYTRKCNSGNTMLLPSYSAHPQNCGALHIQVSAETRHRRIELVKSILTKGVEKQLFFSIHDFPGNFLYVITYGRLESELMWKSFLERYILPYKATIDDVFKCVIWTAMMSLNGDKITSQEQEQNQSLRNLPVPFDLVKKYIEDSELQVFEKFSPLFEVLLNSTPKEILSVCNLSNSSVIITEIPNVWEVLFLNGGGLYFKQMQSRVTKEEWPVVVEEILKSGRYMSCCSLGLILEKIRSIAGLLVMPNQIETVFADVVLYLWEMNRECCICYIKHVLKDVMNYPNCNTTIIRQLAVRIPVQLIVVGEIEGWMRLVELVEDEVRRFLCCNNNTLDKTLLCEVHKRFGYTRESD